MNREETHVTRWLACEARFPENKEFTNGYESK
jgi:hypothetical protein